MRLIRLLKNDIAKESAEWVREGIIKQSQAEQICALYQVDYQRAHSHSFAYQVLIGLGYLFIGLALITLIGANWEDIPRAVRMWGLIALTMATQGLGLYRYFNDQKSAATGLFLLGNLFFGASIILIAQIYHLGEHMPDGIFWWALGCLPIAIISLNTWLMLQTAILAITWFVLEVNLGFFPVFFPVFLLAILYVLVRGKESILLLMATIAAITLWFEYSLAELWRDGFGYNFHSEHIIASVALFIFAYALSHWLNRHDSVKRKDYAAILAVWCLRFGLLLLMILSFEDPWRSLLKADWEQQSSMLIVIGLLSGLALYFIYQTQKWLPMLFIMLFYWLSVVVLLFLANDFDSSANPTAYAVHFQVVYNFVLIGSGVWLIVNGVHQGISHYFFLGVSTILIAAFLRYIDLIGDYVGAAILFLLFAVLLLGAAKYWKRSQSRAPNPGASS